MDVPKREKHGAPRYEHCDRYYCAYLKYPRRVDTRVARGGASTPLRELSEASNAGAAKKGKNAPERRKDSPLI